MGSKFLFIFRVVTMSKNGRSLLYADYPFLQPKEMCVLAQSDTDLVFLLQTFALLSQH